MFCKVSGVVVGGGRGAGVMKALLELVWVLDDNDLIADPAVGHCAVGNSVVDGVDHPNNCKPNA